MSDIFCENTSDEIKRFKFYMCEKGNCKFFKNKRCSKNRRIVECARKGLKDKE